jgi:predicted Ser/Thr protein kinase
MNTPSACPKCGAALPVDAPEGLCPACLMSGAFPTEAETVKLSGAAPRQLTAPAPAELAPLFPNLEILELLGRGGMGAVYKARQKNLNRLVALKILPVEAGADEHFAERFQREAQALAKLNHPNIVTVYEVGQNQGLFYFLMEYVDGANLRALIRGGEMTPEAMLSLIPAFCDALQYAHDEGIVHRDIKPENVLVDKKGRLKIADFGLAKLLGCEGGDHTLTRTGMHLGTPRYMAPEQMDKPETVDHRADIYSLGVVFYEMLTGEVPMGRFEPPSKKVRIDVKIDEIVLHAMEREPDRRYQHASEIKSDVEMAVRHSSSAAVESRGVPSPAATRGRRQVSWLLAFSLLLVSWLLPALLWNLRAVGCAVALLLMGGLFAALAFRRMESLSAAVELWNSLSKPRKAVRLTWALLMAALGFFFLIGALETRWEARPLNWNRDGQSLEEFAAANKGQEYKLIRQLSAFRDNVPSVELSTTGTTWTSGWNAGGIFGRGGPHHGLFDWSSIGMSLLMAFFCFGSVLATMALPSGWPWFERKQNLTIWHASLSLTFSALLSGLGAYGALWLFQGLTLPRSYQWLNEPTFTVNFKPELAREAFQNWLRLEGYATGDQSRWSLVTVPKGETLGEVNLLQAWKPSPFDRWRMTLRGPVRAAPHLAVKMISSAKPAETIIRISSGDPPKDAQMRAAWQSQMDQLASAIKLAGGATAEDNAPLAAHEAADLLQRVAKKYAGLSSISATGKVVAEMTPATGGATMTMEHRFSMNLGRPDFYRIEWTQKMQAVAGFEMKGAVWNAGDGTFLLTPGGKVTQLLNREQALAVATGISGGAAHRVPSLFFKEESLNWLAALKNPALLPDELVGGEACHVISAESATGREVIWFTKKDLLLRQIRSTFTGSAIGEGLSESLAKMSDVTLQKMAKITGQEDSVQTVGDMRKKLDSLDKKVSQMGGVITQTFDTVSVNDLMVKDDFEHPVPANAAKPPSAVAPPVSASPPASAKSPDNQ